MHVSFRTLLLQLAILIAFQSFFLNNVSATSLRAATQSVKLGSDKHNFLARSAAQTGSEIPAVGIKLNKRGGSSGGGEGGGSSGGSSAGEGSSSGAGESSSSGEDGESGSSGSGSGGKTSGTGADNGSGAASLSRSTALVLLSVVACVAIMRM